MSDIEIGPREHMGMGASDPANPTNKKDYDLLPNKSPCRYCYFFEGLIESKILEGLLAMTVICGSATEKFYSLILLASQAGDVGVIYRGRCFNGKGYTLHGVTWSEQNGRTLEELKPFVTE